MSGCTGVSRVSRSSRCVFSSVSCSLSCCHRGSTADLRAGVDSRNVGKAAAPRRWCSSKCRAIKSSSWIFADAVAERAFSTVSWANCNSRPAISRSLAVAELPSLVSSAMAGGWKPSAKKTVHSAARVKRRHAAKASWLVARELFFVISGLAIAFWAATNRPTRTFSITPSRHRHPRRNT